MINYRYEDYSELEAVYACKEFPLATLFNSPTIDLYRALKLDFDVEPLVMPTQNEVLISIILYTKHFGDFYGIILDILNGYDFGGAKDEYLSIIEGDRKSLVKCLLSMRNSHKDFLNYIPDLVADKLNGL